MPWSRTAILKYVANVNTVDQYSFTPLRRTRDDGQLAIAKLLIDKGGIVASRDINGITSQQIFTRTENLEVAKLLIEKAVDVSAKDTHSGFTPLDFAYNGEPRIIELLRQHGSIRIGR